MFVITAVSGLEGDLVLRGTSPEQDRNLLFPAGFLIADFLIAAFHLYLLIFQIFDRHRPSHCDQRRRHCPLYKKDRLAGLMFLKELVIFLLINL